MDIAKLGMQIDHRPADRARESLGRFAKSGRQASGAATDVERKTDAMNKSLKGSAVLAGRAAVALSGLAAGYVSIAGASAAINTGRRFNAALAETSTLIKGTPEQMRALKREAMALVDAYGGDATAKTKAFYQAISAGAGGIAASASLLNQSNKLAIGGVTDLVTGVDALTTATNAYLAKGLTAAEASDAMFVAMRAGKTTIGELSGQLGQIVPIASAAGVSFDEVVGGIAALTTQGQSTAMATTGLRGAIAAVINPTQQAKEVADALGISFNTQALQAEGLAGFLEDVIDKTGGNQEAMAKLFGSVEALNAVLAFAGGAGGKFADIMEDMANKAGATDEAYRKMAEGLDQRLTRALGKLSNIGLQIGNQLLAVWVPAVERAVDVAQYFVEHADLIGSVLLGLAASPIPVAVSAMMSMTGVVGGLTVALKGLTTAAWAATGPWGMLAGLVAGAASYFLLFRDSSKETKDAASLAGDYIASLSGELALFSETYAPTAAQRAIELANDYHKLAKAARDAAAAQLAAMQAEQARLEGMIANGHLRNLTDKERAIMQDRLAGGATRLEKTELALAEAERKRRLAADHVTGAMSDQMTATKKLHTEITVTTKGMGALGGAAGAAGADLKGFVDTLLDAAHSAQEFGNALGNAVISGIDGAANAWGDFVARGLTDFSGFVDNILGSFQSMLAQMIALAARNRIMISLGLGGTSATLAGTMGIGNGGILGGLFGAGGGGALSGLWSGLGGVLSGGGLGSSFANLGGLLTGASSGPGAIGAAIPAIGLVAAGFSLLIGRTRELDSGLRVTVDGFDSLVETFSVVERSRLFGLIRSRRTNLSVADAAIADPVALAVAEIQGSVLDMAGVLDIGRAAFADFATLIDISTSGLSDDEAAEAIQEQLIAIADQMSEVALAGFEVVNAGETASEALSRLSSSLKAVTTASDALGHSFDQAGVLGAALASSIVEAFGGLEAYSTATGRYFELFYTEEERRAALTRQATDALAALNVAMPQSRAEYRAMIEALDLTTEAGRNAYAALIGMADVMDSVLPSVQNFTDMMAALVGSTSSVLDQMISESNSMMRSAETAAANWYRASETIKDLVSDILNANTATVSGQDQARRYNLSQYETALAAARGGDVDAARNIPALASAYLNSVENTAGTYAEFQAAQARVLGDARFLSGIAALEGANQDVMVTLYQEQIGILQDVYDYLSTTDTIDPDDISSFENQLNSLQAAIEAAELFSYDYLRERLRVTVDLLATSDIPEAVQTLIQSAATGIDATINFAVYAPDLTPDLRWLALNGASEHLSTIDFALGNTLSAETIELALLTSGSVTRTIRAVMRNTLSHDEMLLALAGSSELARVVNVALGSGSSEQAIQLALGNVGSYAVNVRTALTASPQVRQIVFGDTGSYAAMIEAAFSADLTPAQRRVLLRQQGAYSVNILATLSQAIPDDIRALILNANTSAIRAITIATAFADSVDPDELPLLLEEATEVLRLITFGVNPTGVTPFDVLLLDVFTSETDSVVRTIKGKIDASEVWNQNFWKELRWGEPVQTRTIKGKVNAAAVWSNPFWAELRRGDEWRTRGITGGVNASNVWGNPYWAEIRQGEEWRTRGIKGKVNVADVWQNPYWQDLRDGPEWRTRGIVGQVNVAGVWKNAYWQDLRDGETWRTRGITGQVNVSQVWQNPYWQDLRDGAEWRTRGMTAAINVSQVWQNPFWAELRDGETWQVRGITGLVNAASVWENGYWQELRSGAEWRTRGITGLVDASSVWSNGFWGELRWGQTWRTRGIEAAIDVSDVWQNAFWRDLRNGAEWRTRGITAQIDVSNVWRNAFWQELRDGTEWQVRGITGRVNASSVWSNGFWAELRTGAEWRTRGIVASINTSDVWQNAFWRDLRDGETWRTRGIVGAVDASGVWSTALWSELRWGDEWRTRGLRGAVDVSAVWQTNYWRELLRGDEWRRRGLTGSIDLGQLTGDEWDFFDALREGSTTIERIIEGVVDLSGLTDRQRSLLDMIRGTSTGTVTLGGSFVFDPSDSFTTWWESTTTDNLTTPMSVLTDALTDLREATLENIATMREVQLSSYLASLTTNNRGMTFMDEAEIRTVAEMMGIDQSDVTLGNLMWRIAQNSRTDALERVIYDPTGAEEARFLDGLSNDHASGYTRSDFSIVAQDGTPWIFDVTGPLGGVQRGLSYEQAYALMDDVITGMIPAFAMGGTHAGGLRLVGENGPELEATGPSRIYSASQTKDLLSGGGSDLAQKVQDMTEELEALRSESTQLLARIYRADRDTAKRLERLEKTGFPTKDYVE